MKRFYLDCNINWRGTEFVEYASIDCPFNIADAMVVDEVKKYFEKNNRSVCTPTLIIPNIDTSLGLYVLIW